MIFLFDIGTVPTVWYFLFFLLFISCNERICFTQWLRNNYVVIEANMIKASTNNDLFPNWESNLILSAI